MKKFLALLIALVMALSLVACGNANSSSAAPADSSGSGTAASEPGESPANEIINEEASTEGGPETLRVGTANSLGTFLMNDFNGDCYTGIYLVYDSIFDYDPVTKEATSQVLSDWGLSEDGSALNMTVAPGVTFSNGDVATAEDVVFSMRVYVDMSSMTTAFFMPYDFDNAEYSEDGMSVSIPMTSEFSPAVWEIGNLPLYDKAWADEVGLDSDLWTTAPVGSGPFAVTEYVTDSHVYLERRADYWGTYDSNVQKVEITYYGEPATMYMDLETGSIDLALELLDNDYTRGLEDGDNIEVALVSAGENRLLNFDLNTEALQNENVRLAIAHAVNWDDVADAAAGDTAIPASSLIISSSEYYENQGQFEYDPELAKQLLDEAGYGDGLTLTMISTDEADQVAMSTVVQEYLAQVGITLEYTSLDFPSALAKWLAGGESDLSWTDSSLGSINSEPFVSVRATWPVTGGMPGVIVTDEQYVAYLEGATYTSDPAVRAENWSALQEYNKEHCFVITVVEEAVAVGWNSEVISNPNLLNGTDANLRNIVWAD